MMSNIQIEMEMEQEALGTPAPGGWKGTLYVWGLLAHRWPGCGQDHGEGNLGSTSVSGAAKSEKSEDETEKPEGERGQNQRREGLGKQRGKRTTR